MAHDSHRAQSTLACLLLLVANIVNIAADLGGMAAAMSLITGVTPRWFVVPFALLIMLLLIVARYQQITSVLKWTTLVLFFAYVVAGFLARPDWPAALRATVTPRFAFDADHIGMLVALLGTSRRPSS